jgi:sortase B
MYETWDEEKKRKRKLRILYIVLAVSVVAITVFVTVLVMEMRETRQGQDFFANIDVEVTPPTPPPTPTPTPTPAPGIIEPPEEEVYIPFEPAMDFDELREQMPNIVGWILSEGTVINYPIVWGTDNDFYLYHLPDGTSNRLGSIFLDYRSSGDFSDCAMMIFGHNTSSRDMFGSLLYYANQEQFDQHPTMYIFTPTHNFRLELLAGYEVDSALEIPPMSFSSAGHFYTYIAEATRRSTFESPVEASFGDRIVHLVTCADFGPITQRVIIVGRLVEMLY